MSGAHRRLHRNLEPHPDIHVDDLGLRIVWRLSEPSKFWENAHMYFSWVMAGLVAIHILAALRHHFVKGNDVMRRMWRSVDG